MLLVTINMTSYEVAKEIRDCLPGTQEIIIDYLSGYLVDDAGEDEDSIQVAKDMLESFAEGRKDALEELVMRLSRILEAQISAREKTRAPKLLKLDRVMDLSKTGAMSNTIAFTEGVDLESINKSKLVGMINMNHMTDYGLSEPRKSTSRNWKSKKLN